MISRLDTELVAKNSTENIKNVLTFTELTFWREIQRMLCIQCPGEDKYFEEKGRIKNKECWGRFQFRLCQERHLEKAAAEQGHEGSEGVSQAGIRGLGVAAGVSSNSI